MALSSHFKLRPPKVSILVFYAQSTSTIAQNKPNKKQTNKQTINECYWRNPPVRSGQKAISDSVFSPKITPINRKQTKRVLLAKCPCRPSRTSSHLRLCLFAQNNHNKKGGGGERVLPAKSSWRPIPTRSYRKLSLFAQNNPNKSQTIFFFFFFFKVLLVKSPWRPIRTRNHLKFSQIAQNNPNTKQTKKPSVTGKIALEADPDEKPPQTPSDRPKQPQQKANKQTTKNRVLLSKSTWRRSPTRNRLKLGLFIQNNHNKKQTNQKNPSVTGKSPWRRSPTRNHLKLVLFTQNNHNKKQTNQIKPSVTGEVPLEVDPAEEPYKTWSVHPKQPQQKAN